MGAGVDSLEETNGWVGLVGLGDWLGWLVGLVGWIGLVDWVGLV